jgi:uncharacterized protein (DUF2249 family)/quercetin dioxygenase-like cupin family protein
MTAAVDELDVREIAKPERHRLIFDRFDRLGVGESFDLVNNHDPKHLRQEFDRDHPGAYGWEYLVAAQRMWRIRITRQTEADVPRVLCDLASLPAADDAAGAVWKLELAQRQLDANVVRLRPHSRVELHTGPDLDVLMHVLAGSGELTTAIGVEPLAAGAVIWLPRRSQRAISAGTDGLSYLTVHPRRPALTVAAAPHRTTEPDSSNRNGR